MLNEFMAAPAPYVFGDLFVVVCVCVRKAGEGREVGFRAARAIVIHDKFCTLH